MGTLKIWGGADWGAGQWVTEVGGATWFLAPLFLAYIIFFLFTKYTNAEVAFCLYCFEALLGMIMMECVWDLPFVNYFTGRGIGGFFCGVIFEKCLKRIKGKIKGVFISILCILLMGKAFYDGIRFLSDFRFLVILVICPCYILLCEENKVIRMLMENKLFIKLGSISMEVYMLHLPLCTWIGRICKRYFYISMESYTFIVVYAVVLLFIVTIWKKYESIFISGLKGTLFKS